MARGRRAHQNIDEAAKARIRRLRQTMTQADVAARFGVSPSTIADIEREPARPPAQRPARATRDET